MNIQGVLPLSPLTYQVDAIEGDLWSYHRQTYANPSSQQ
jgi:hypothetical protein